MELTNIRLLVDNYKACFVFYRDVLGFAVSWGDEDSNYADFEFAGVNLSLFVRKQMADAIGAEYHLLRKRSDKTALIFKVDNVEEKYRELQKKVDFITEPTVQEGWGIKVAHFRDPAGNLLEIYENLDSMNR
ncbi:VOC family protein [Planococcus sp. CAU13]|uniref:VOC family protein n=1 Tax=Planococcus sp. CAU13 TaxID=1541197 RepID=UPI00068C408C|nr:VOC family protein [Planococcus sp. CAU13]